MPKIKAGTLKPVIDQIKKTIQEKGESLSQEERRQLTHRLKRMQRKGRRIRTLEENRTVVAAKPKGKPETTGGEAEPAAGEAEAS